MLDVLDGVAHPGVVIEGWSCKLPQQLTFMDVFSEGRVGDLGSCRRWVASHLGFNNLSLDHLVKDSEVRRSIDFKLAL